MFELRHLWIPFLLCLDFGAHQLAGINSVVGIVFCCHPSSTSSNFLYKTWSHEDHSQDLVIYLQKLDLNLYHHHLMLGEWKFYLTSAQEDLRHDFMLIFWFILKGLQLLFLRFVVSEKKPDAIACWNQSSNSSSSSDNVISTSKSQWNFEELDLCAVLSKATILTWKLGWCVLGRQSMLWNCREEMWW